MSKLAKKAAVVVEIQLNTHGPDRCTVQVPVKAADVAKRFNDVVIAMQNSAVLCVDGYSMVDGAAEPHTAFSRIAIPVAAITRVVVKTTP